MTLPLPPDPEGQNDNHARSAAEALRAYSERTGCGQEDSDTRLTDMLADLRHWCDRNDADWYACLKRAAEHYREETLPGDKSTPGGNLTIGQADALSKKASAAGPAVRGKTHPR